MIPTFKRCGVFGCDRPQVGQGLCDLHYRRMKRHGHLDQTRPNDWGDRSGHPLYKYWSQQRRNGMPLCEEWHRDFWAFVRDVVERPSANHMLVRPDKDHPMGPGNCGWSESKGGDARDDAHVEHRQARKHYQAKYQRDRRAGDPFHEFRNGLKKAHGITLENYEAMMAAQDDVCAICGRQEHRRATSGARTYRLAVDHCHSTHKIRGLLCSFCNHAIGYLEDSPVLLRRAIDYLRDPPAASLGIKHNGKHKTRRLGRPPSPYLAE